MQQPTLTGVRIRSTRDALKIFFGVACKKLPIITRRLDAEERRAIKPGNIYVWEERCANAEATGLGMERWTDGMGWGPSRVRDEFLFYHQRESETSEDPNNPSAKWANMMKRREPRAVGPSYSRVEAERLIKQTYSVHVSLPEDLPHNVTRKWHLTAYFSQTTLDSLMTLDKVPEIGNVVVPPGWFRSARASKNRRTDPAEGVSVTSCDVWQGQMPGYDVTYFALEGSSSLEDRMYASTSYSAQAHAESSYMAAYQDTHRHSPAEFGSFSSTHSSPSSYANQLPTLSDTGLTMYRDPSPSTTSSTNSDFSVSPHAISPLSTQTSSRFSSVRASRNFDSRELDLVPLQYLENISPPSRDPMDEDVLRRLSRTKLGSSPFGTPRI